MAANLKAAGEERTKARCPVCHVVIGLDKLYSHISYSCAKHGGVGAKDDTAA